jgi:hypothetical protein
VFSKGSITRYLFAFGLSSDPQMTAEGTVGAPTCLWRLCCMTNGLSQRHATLVHDNGSLPLRKSDINVGRVFGHQRRNQKRTV